MKYRVKLMYKYSDVVHVEADIVQHIVSALSSAPSAEPANFDASDTNFRSVLVPLYEASILSAAVDAAIERAADEVLNLLDATRHDKYNAAVKEAAEAIRALQSPGGLAALREFGMRVAAATYNEHPKERAQTLNQWFESIVDLRPRNWK